MKNILIVILLVFSFSYSFSQVSGVSASKLATICTSPVAPKIIEAEPSFSFGYSNKYFNETGKLTNSFENKDSTELESGYGFRFTYGVINNLEIGTTFSSDFSELSFGAKYKLFQINNLSSAIMTGINLPMGNNVFDKSLNLAENKSSFASGIVLTYDFNDKNSIDFDCQVQKFTSEVVENHVLDYFIDCDISHWLTSELQLIAGLNYANLKFDNYEENSLTLNLGTTIERQNNYLLVLNSPINLIGKNTKQVFGFGFALTISID